MGLLVNGQWQDRWYDTSTTGGHFVRTDASFRNWVTPTGASGPSGTGGFKAEPGRYHLYVSLACPWAHRTLISRTLKKLDDAISVSVVDPFMGDSGWTFGGPDGTLFPGSTADGVNETHYLYEIYRQASPGYTGRVTVPVLWDKHRKTIVNNESAEIIRMLNNAFDEWADAKVDFSPPALRPQIDEVNAFVYDNINNGVYKCGFATTQAAYEKAFDALFAALDRIETQLAAQRYLAGDRLTESDWRLFTTLVRFDSVYYGHFKCNLRRLVDYPNLWNYTRELYQTPGVAGTVNLAHIKRHYYMSHATINPTRIIPKGPLLDFGAPHQRDRFLRQ